MTFWGLVRSGLAHHRRMYAAVALGVLAATAVLTGALLVGDSVRGSLRELALDRLGPVDSAVVTPSLFRAELADELAASDVAQPSFSGVYPAIGLEGSMSHGATGARASRVSLWGITDEFAKHWPSSSDTVPADGEIALNETLAAELQAKVGDEVVVRLPLSSDIPSDTPLGRKSELVSSRRWKVSAILPAKSVGDFALRPNQQFPLVAVVLLRTLQDALAQPGKANTLLITGAKPSAPATRAENDRLQAALRPTLADAGVRLTIEAGGYANLTSERMLLPEAIERPALAAFTDQGVQPVLTYLANWMRPIRGPEMAAQGSTENSPSGPGIPYSTVAAVDPAQTPPFGPLSTQTGEALGALGDDEIALNRWAADDLAAQGAPVAVGDSIELTYFEPESTHGVAAEGAHVFRLVAILEMSGAAIDRAWTPELAGVTDQASIDDWNPPFPYDSDRVRTVPPQDQDEAYWQTYRATPKAFVSLNMGRKLWASRFGQSTSLRTPVAAGATVEEIAKKIDFDPMEAGFEARPVKRLAIEASRGTTAFDGLFLGFSFFIIAAALALVSLLFRLGVERRARELGILLALGWPRSRTRRLLLAEGSIVSLAGALLGAAAGVGYAWLMLAGLRSFWVAAITTPFLHLHVGAASLLIGVGAGVALSLLTIAFATRSLTRNPATRLLANQTSASSVRSARGARASKYLAWGAMTLALGVGLFATRLGGIAQAGAFFGAGGLSLVALLTFLWRRMRGADTASLASPGPGALARLAARNGARHPGRSALSIGLVAAASFLIMSISAFRLDPPAALEDRASGGGGYALFAETSHPLFHDLNTADGRSELALPANSENLAQGVEVAAFRSRAGDDASCLNLFQAREPRVLGVGPKFVERGGFAWSASAANSDRTRENPWLLLEESASGETDNPIPVVLDANTSQYGLHLAGIGATYELPPNGGKSVAFRVVGLLSNSVFQGDLLISESNFLRVFPETSGASVFLIDAPAERVDALAQAWEEGLADDGFDAERVDRRLAGFMVVQNTYLSTFQSLGGLGLLLGTFGVAVVQTRNVIERRAELALLRAVGFRRRRLLGMVLLENGLMLVLGLAVGIAAAAVAVAPHLFGGRSGLPWTNLAGTFVLVLAVGLLAGWGAARATLKAPLLPALKGD